MSARCRRPPALLLAVLLPLWSYACTCPRARQEAARDSSAGRGAKNLAIVRASSASRPHPASVRARVSGILARCRPIGEAQAAQGSCRRRRCRRRRWARRALRAAPPAALPACLPRLPLPRMIHILHACSDRAREEGSGAWARRRHLGVLGQRRAAPLQSLFPPGSFLLLCPLFNLCSPPPMPPERGCAFLAAAGPPAFPHARR